MRMTNYISVTNMVKRLRSPFLFSILESPETSGPQNAQKYEKKEQVRI